MTPNFNKITELSKKIAKALLKDQAPTDLENSELFTQTDKAHILDQLTNDENIKARLKIVKAINKEERWKQLKSKINVPVRKLYWKYTVTAASIVILISTAFWLTKPENPSEQQFTEPIIVNNQIETGTNKATLTLEDGSQVALEKGTAYQTTNVKSNGEEIVYEAGERNKAGIVFNTLTIPRGGQFYIVLSDGTKVWLNSESEIKYPVAFADGETRQVELVYGEAYFNVSPSTDHKGSKFKVFNQSQEVEVLGTEFNIKAYKDETNIYTTLVEGKVAVNTKNKNQLLIPNQQLNLDITTNNIAVSLVDIRTETSWKDGSFNFIKGKPLKEIMITLSRWYDVEIVFENKSLETVIFKGVLRKQQSIEEILSSIKSVVITNYEINNKTIYIK